MTFRSISREKPPPNHYGVTFNKKVVADKEYDIDAGYNIIEKKTPRSDLQFSKKPPKKYFTTPEEVLPGYYLDYRPNYKLVKPRTDHCIYYNIIALNWKLSTKEKGSFIKTPEDMSIKNTAFWKMYNRTKEYLIYFYRGNLCALDYDESVLSTRKKQTWSVPMNKTISRPAINRVTEKRRKGLYTQPGELDVNYKHVSPRTPAYDMSKSLY